MAIVAFLFFKTNFQSVNNNFNPFTVGFAPFYSPMLLANVSMPETNGTILFKGEDFERNFRECPFKTFFI
ncbi:hypothetical protein GCM10007096_05420 [Pullulanibacillus pueri]|uniref:Uncharacterized protein n=1 Tax=Pullulanibacillus pueri TaxID=1437324 RepID=A0A8J2ZT78_9BACL|nr:hypothetical protein GCM10007096_05420 [Pullulanibacillus pueri]